MPHPFLSKHALPSQVTGQFLGGSLAYSDDQYVVLDTTSAAPRLLVLNPSFAYQRAISVPVHSKGYVGVSSYGNSVVLLRPKGTICEDGKIAVAELVSVSLLTGQVNDTREIRSFYNLNSIQGLVESNDGLITTAVHAGMRSFYRIVNNELEKVAEIGGDDTQAYVDMYSTGTLGLRVTLKPSVATGANGHTFVLRPNVTAQPTAVTRFHNRITLSMNHLQTLNQIIETVNGNANSLVSLALLPGTDGSTTMPQRLPAEMFGTQRRTSGTSFDTYFHDGVNPISLAADGNHVFLTNGQEKAYAYSERWLTADTAEDITLQAANTLPVGAAWVGSAIAVMSLSPAEVYLYGTSGGGTPGGGGGGGPIAVSTNRQLFMADNRLETFSANGVSFKAIYSEFVRRIPIAEGSVIRVVQEAEVRITPEFILSNVKVGTMITGSGASFRVTGVYKVGASYRQSFACKEM